MMTYTIEYRQALTILRALEYYNANVDVQPLTKHEKRAEYYHSKEMIKLFTNE
jgi:hypothetical protein